MAKHLNARLLRPPSTTKPQPPPLHPRVRHNTLPLPPSSQVLRKPLHPGPKLPAPAIAGTPSITHGQQIFLYLNPSTNQVLYSLTRHLDNAAANRQLPFMGKKTQLPRGNLRKDKWQPMAMVQFPNAHKGLDAYRKLREFRRLHETSYPLEDITYNADSKRRRPGTLFMKRDRKKYLMNQRLNSVADLAAVLCQLEAGPSEERRERCRRALRRAEWKVKTTKMGFVEGEAEEVRVAKERRRRELRVEKVDVEREMTGCEGVEVQWMDLMDAEVAERWPVEVRHSFLWQSRYTAATPYRDVEREEQVEEYEKELDEEWEGRGREKEEVKREKGPSEEAVEGGLELSNRTWREYFFGRKDDGQRDAKR